MRILQYNLTTTTKQGGVETFVWELSRELARRGHTLTILGGAAPATPPGILRSIPGVRVRQVPFVDRRRWQSLPPLRKAYSIVKLLERLSMLPPALPQALRRFDIVHIHKPYDLPLLALARLRGAHTVYHGHGGDFYPGDAALMRFADTLLSCSAFNAGQLRERYARAASVVYNGYDIEHFTPRPADLALRDSIAPRGAKLLIYAGRLMPWKGVEHLIGALSLLEEKRTSLAILMAGEDKAQREQLERVARERGVQTRVKFLGPLPHRELPRYYALADLVVAASYASETFGMALVEAMGCGKAVVASSFGGFAEVVAHGETGLLTPPRDEQAMARAMAALLADDARRAAMGEAGRRRAQALFSWRAVADRVEAAYSAGIHTTASAQTV
jgi:D-inositol-3-phosphate glycosyltransferase